LEPLEEIANRAEEEGDLEKAFSAWHRLCLKSNDPVHFCRLGYVAKNLEMWDEAEKAFLDALQLDPRFPEALQGLGCVYLYRSHEDSDAELARDCFAQALELQSTAHGATLLGATYARLGQNELARSAYQQALGIDPNYEEAYFNIAKLDEEVNPPEAIKGFEKAIEIDPEYPAAHQEVAKLYQHGGDLVRAEYHFRRSLEADPTDYWSHLFLANLLAVQGKTEEAEATYRFVTSLRPEIKGGLEFFARFLDSIGKHKEAAELRADD
jgi:tetratricopeptide (TPR) repeat protein